MTSNEIRRSFLAFFEQHGHRIVPSSSLVPADDPTLLFTNAGMNQFKDVFLGKERRDYSRATSSQKCMRVSGKHNDLENVGPSLRHHTFFEMLGNFSFGDYFKRDAIRLAWTLLTDVWKIPADRLYATVFAGDGEVPRDQEAYDEWLKYVPAERISELGEDNFWAMGETGPCGRCSEVHYFRGAELPCSEPECLGVACTCDRFVEIWNNVFMEFDRAASGVLTPLPAKCIDTGMGLERITAVLQGHLSNYDTDLFTPLIKAIGEMTGTRYGGSMSPADISTRVVADHLRATTFLVADGVVPSNEWRGYVLRKIMRRAMRHGKALGLTDPSLHRLVDVLVQQMGSAYPELKSGRDYIVQVVRGEEERFETVLSVGLPRLEEALDRAAASATHVLPGDEAFKLYDTFGVPQDFIEDLAGQRKVSVDAAGFRQAMEAQKQKARAKSGFDTGARGDSFAVADDSLGEALRAAGDRFEGYTTTHVEGARVLAVFAEDRQQVPELSEGGSGYLALDRTPFYVESGGQVSDTGVIAVAGGRATAAVEGLAKGPAHWPRLHRVHLTAGVVRPGDVVTAEVDRDARESTRRHHTATHLLHAALRQVLGNHVKQAGSLVAPDRLRFDFVHFAPVTPEQLGQIERIVNEQICRNVPVETEVRSTQEAIAAGAMALFGEKYGDTVRVVAVPGFSLELCGGTHVHATGDIGFFTIVQEGGIAAGVRRIEAITGPVAVAFYQEQRRELEGVLGALNTTGAQAVETIERLFADVKHLTRDNSQLKMKLALGAGGHGAAHGDDTVDIGGIKLVRRRVEGLEKDALRGLSDTLKARIKSGVVVLASAADDKVAIVVAVTPDLTKKVQAGKVVKQIAPIVGGGGGGRPDFAEAGGRSADKIDEMLAASEQVIREMLGV